MEISLSPIENGTRASLVAASIRDISERLAAAAALRAERDHVTAVIEVLRDGMPEYDTAPGVFVREPHASVSWSATHAEEVLAAPHPPPWWPDEGARRRGGARQAV